MSRDSILAGVSARRCRTPGCQRPYRARGYCVGCYATHRASGDLVVILPRRTDELCCVCRGKPRMPRGGYCRQCASEYERERRAKNADEINARARARYTPERARRDKLSRYSLMPEQFAALLVAQDGRCAVCRAPGDLHVDHDHGCCPESLRSCGKCVRGLLCSNCNNGLGRFGDDPDRLDKAAAYLRDWAVAQRAGASS